MKKRFIVIALLAVSMLFVLCGCQRVEDMGSLPQLSRPYVGEYQCEKLQLGGDDFADKFDYVKLTLNYDGTFTLSYRDEQNRKGEYSGEYSVSPNGEEITLSAQMGLRTLSRTFRMEKGTVLIDLTLGQKLLHAEFKRP